ncbi:LysR family transcriptional regulator [Sphingomonas sp. OK281]|uniref:LysR family transcriptional regulator n=1 Tax=Sphingomonas sp. OK281 TaxID=1881067 RepID=UPI0008E50F5D|nr:LysR family transcriptional regulator [Sphingomonas sp. OK281]SFO34095.1 transcriptional regulator, LysR family [Sphingomonas sp. OK281]
MDRDLWSGLAVFETIVEAGSFARAATRLGVSASALSHAMRSLETKLGVRLLDRTTRSLAPTPAGEELLARLRPAIASVTSALEGLDRARDRPAGRIRVSAHRVAAVYAILPRLADFARAFPDVAVELVVDDGFVDIVADRFDCGVRHAQTLQADMISVRISAAVPLVFVAAPAYLAERAAPVDPDDLAHHRCLCYRYTSSGVVHRWTFERDGRTLERSVRGDFITNDIDVMRDAALAGLGVTCLPLPHAALQLEDGTLVEVLAGWAPTLAPNHLYYPNKRQPTAAFRAFVAAMRV